MTGLLRQPHGFEGVGPAWEPLPPHGGPVLHRPHLADAPVGLDPALLPKAPHGCRREHLVSGVDEFMDLNMGVIELAPEVCANVLSPSAPRYTPPTPGTSPDATYSKSGARSPTTPSMSPRLNVS